MTGGIIEEDEKCIIFLSLGELSIDFFSGKYGFDFLDILIGKGNKTIRIDDKTCRGTNTFYLHEAYIYKHNGSEINANFFNAIDNTHISGIIFTDADMNEFYNLKNTYLFINPFADKKINVKDFRNLIYWKKNNKNEYIPRCNGKDYWHKI